MEEEVLPLRNMKEHFTWQSPSGSLPLHTYCQNIDSRGGSKLHLTLLYQTLCPFELLIVHGGGLCWTRGCIFRSFPHVFRGRTGRTNLGLPTYSGSKRFPGRSQQWEEPLSETPDLREGSHSGCGANGILVWWLSCHRASGSRIEHVYLRGKKNKTLKHCYIRWPETFLVKKKNLLKKTQELTVVSS